MGDFEVLGNDNPVGPWEKSPIVRVAVTAALWTEVRAYLLGAALYLPEEWLTDSARERARVPTTIGFQEKWRQALMLLRQVRASGFIVTGVLADAEFGRQRAVSRHVAPAAALAVGSVVGLAVATLWRRTPGVGALASGDALPTRPAYVPCTCPRVFNGLQSTRKGRGNWILAL